MDTKSDYTSHSPQEFSKQIEKIDNKLVMLLEKYDLQQTVHAFKEVFSILSVDLWFIFYKDHSALLWNHIYQTHN